jgi:hypothetical protein
MNMVYESLRTLLRNKELEIKKLEKEIEALRIVLPIVAEAGEAAADAISLMEPVRSAADPMKVKAPTAGPDFDNVMAQVKATQPSSAQPPQNRPSSIADGLPGKSRTSWP